MLNKINISPQKQNLCVCVVLIVVSLTVYWQVNQFDFINLDDPTYFTNNSHVQSGITLDGVRWAFGTTYGDFWFPLTWLSLMFDYQFHGLNAGGYHITNLILHILSTLLLFWLFNRMTGAIWKSAFVAALFALHPLHVESVAWITKRKDVLSAFFWMLTLCLYVYYTGKPLIRRYLFVLFSFVCALMSKPMVVTLPVIMILLDYWPLGRFRSKKEKVFSWQLKEKTPFFILSAAFSVITIYAQDRPSVKIIQHSLASRLANAPVSFMTYLEKTFWPHNLAVFYPFPDQLPVWQVLSSAMLILVITIAVIIVVKRLPYLLVGWLWYAITIMPVLGIIQVNLRAMCDNYTYLPSIGISIMLAWGIPLLFPREDMRKNFLLSTGMVVIVILSVLTWQQCGYWKNSIELWNHAVKVTKNNYWAHNLFAAALAEEGRIGEAIDNYNEAIRLNPNYPELYNNRGTVYDKTGQHQRAIDDYNEAIRLDQNYADAYNNRGATYDKTGRHQRAIDDYNEAIRLNPNYPEVYNNIGLVYGKLGQYKQAIDNFNKAISLNKNYTNAYNNRGFAYLLQDNKKLGCRDAQKACSLGMCKLFEFAKGEGYCH